VGAATVLQMRDVLLCDGRFLHVRSGAVRRVVRRGRCICHERRGQRNQSCQESEVCYAFHESFHPEPSYSSKAVLLLSAFMHLAHRNSLNFYKNISLPDQIVPKWSVPFP
jgi:hypothetical protein